MSIILKGIDLPHEEINLTITKDGRIYLDNKYHLIAEAIQIPKGHGAIKDIDTFLKDKCLTKYIENDVFNKKYTYTISTVAIYNAPTILEREEEK